MKILVCLKEVPRRETRYQVSRNRLWLDEQDITWETNECDEYALEEALKIRDALGGEVVLLTLGREHAEKSMRKGLAMGADRGILIVDENRQADSPLAVATAIQEAIADESFDMYLTGTQSDDFANAQTGVILAELIGLAYATIVMSIQTAPEGDRVNALREMENGWFQRVELDLPALLTIQAGSSAVRYPSLKGIMQARRKEIRKVPLADLSGGALEIPSPEILELSLPESTSTVQMLEGDTESVVSALFEKLRTEAKVL